MELPKALGCLALLLTVSCCLRCVQPSQNHLQSAESGSCAVGPLGYYSGSLAVTESGSECLNWAEFPDYVQQYPDRGLGNHSYCRNPDGGAMPWCVYQLASGGISWAPCDCNQGATRLSDGGRVELHFSGLWGTRQTGMPVWSAGSWESEPPVWLVAGGSPTAGRVELFLNGQWGSVCGHGWTDRDAAVVCRQLGYSGTARSRLVAYSGAGHGPIHLAHVERSGTERSLGECFSPHRGAPSCRHREAAAVICDSTDEKAQDTGPAGKSYSRTLHQGAVPLLPRQDCAARYGGKFTNRMICAGTRSEDKRVDSCQGDSGGPLVCQRSTGRWVILGITSWGYGCGRKDSPGVYTKDSKFVPWIKKATRL